MRFPLTGLCLLVLSCILALAQNSAPVVSVPTATVEVPHLIRFSGQLKDASGTVGITFSLHKSQNDQTALWIETQNVQLDASGKYSVLLGVTTAAGIPPELFTSGEAQWLAIHVQGQSEQPRVLLVSVPYALKAAEAETLAGHAASDFVTSDKLSTAVQQQLQAQSISSTSTTTPKIKAKPNTTPPTDGATNFTDGTANQVVAVTQTSTGNALTATAPNNTALIASSTATSGNAYGVLGHSYSTSGVGVYGLSHATSGTTYGVEGQTTSPSGIGVFGFNGAASGFSYGVLGQTSSTDGTGVRAYSTATSGTTKGLLAAVSSPDGTAAILQNNGGGPLISGQSGTSHTAVFSVDGSGNIGTTGSVNIGALTTASYPLQVAGSGAFVAYVKNSNTATDTAALLADGDYAGAWGSGKDYGVIGTSSNIGVSGSGVYYGTSGSATSSGGTGAFGQNDNGYGVYGLTKSTAYPAGEFQNSAGAGTAGSGVLAFSGSGVTADDHPTGTSFYSGAVELSGPNGLIAADSTDSGYGYGVVALNYNGEAGVIAVNNAADGYAVWGFDLAASKYSYAGYFSGNVEVTGLLDGATPSARIDDPIDPANKYLTQASVISSEMLSMYSGTIVLDAAGSATVKLPPYFEALNKDFRYQLTCIGGYAPVYVASEVSNNTFSIAGGKPGMKVSWQVSGVRHDAYANAHPLVPEEAKPAHEAGRYLHPVENGASPELAIGRPKQLDVHHTPQGKAAELTPPPRPELHPMPVSATAPAK